MGTTGQVVQGQLLLTRWQVDIIGHLPHSEGYKYAVTCMAMATGLLAAYSTHHPDQKVVITALEPLCTAYG